MDEHAGWLAKILPSPSKTLEDGADINKGYGYFSRGLSFLVMVLVLVPLTIISVLSYNQYKQLLEKNELTQMMLSIEQAQSTIERFVSKIESIIKFVARDDRYEDLINPENLESLFVRLQKEHPDFADIEIIDSEGKQKSYVGDYQLDAQDYSDQKWYKEVLLRGIYISNVFLGYRQVPHFVIAVSRKHPQNEGAWVLRVTIDGKTLQRFVDTIRTTSVDDIFLVDAHNIAQTRPQKYGEVGLENILYTIKKTKNPDISKFLAQYNTRLSKESDIIVQRHYNRQDLLHGSVQLKGTPWRVDMVKNLYLQGESWVSFKHRLFTMFFCCAVVAIFVILKLSQAITDHIQDADTKRYKFLAEAGHANKLASIGRLAAGVAHEINNPLSIINQKAGLVEDYLDMAGNFEYKESIQKAIDGIQNSVMRCKTITHRLLGFARQTDVQMESLNINIVLEEVVGFLAQEATYSQIQIHFELEKNIHAICSDKSQLQQVFLNITNNALHAIGSNGSIVIGSKNIDEEHVSVTITDTGMGMSPEVKRRIFDPFFTTKDTGKGTGLGLSITYGIIKKLGGSIEVESEVGKGTTFEITLPASHNC